MAGDSNRGGLVGENGRFPVGMRVLAVDDDRTCLEILETMLRKCQYQVTTARHAKNALKMLRENRHKYDLVITDVQMPDTDGFQLLEIVGLEMDLPVIMLSDYSDTELVMKGVTHGACDYLSKPVRIEELKNIWQHVVRRFKPKDQIRNLVSQGLDPIGLEETGVSENSSRKRKGHCEEGGDEEEDGAYNDGLPRQKKRRVVWSRELQQKFVEAVNHLGFDKAVPKKILNLMNVEGLSRENVASHLQKFRTGLKKLQTEKPALGHGFGGCHSSGGPGRFSNSSLPSYPPGDPHAALIQPIHSQALNNYFGNSPTLFRGVPPSLELNKLDSFTCGSSNTISNFPTNHLMIRCAFGNQSSFRGVGLLNFPPNSSPWSVPCDASNEMFQPNSFNDYFSPNYGMNNTLRTNEEFLHGRIESHEGFMESIDDLVNTLDKRAQSSTTLLDSESIWV